MQPEPGDGVVTLVVGQSVRPGCTDDFLAWQHRMTAAASRRHGFRGVDLRPPVDDGEWRMVYRFADAADAQDWLDDADRLTLLAAGAPLFAGPGTQQLLTRADDADDAPVTLVVSHRVAPDEVEQYVALQQRFDEAQTRFPGYRGTQMVRPTEGMADTWTVFSRFATAADLERWLTSPQRRDLLDGGAFTDFTMRTEGPAYGSWFPAADGTPHPSRVKTSLAVWAGLYPTVVALTVLAAPLDMPLWLGLLVGNLASSFVMSYVTMPLYVNRLFGWWLTPGGDGGGRSAQARGALLVVGLTAAWAAVFFVLTQHVLPG